MPKNINTTIKSYDEEKYIPNIPECESEGVFRVPTENNLFYTCRKQGNYYIQKVFERTRKHRHDDNNETTKNICATNSSDFIENPRRSCCCCNETSHNTKKTERKK